MKHPIRLYRSVLFGVGLAAALGWITAGADEQAERAADVTAATAQATHWLAALDTGSASEGWDDLAAVMKRGRTPEDWTNDVGAPRVALGKLVMRELDDAGFSTTVRGGPSGKYVTARYLTQFTQAPPRVETVLLTVEDGRWRIAGYNVRPAAEAPAPAPATDQAGDDTGKTP